MLPRHVLAQNLRQSAWGMVELTLNDPGGIFGLVVTSQNRLLVCGISLTSGSDGVTNLNTNLMMSLRRMQLLRIDYCDTGPFHSAPF